MEFLRGDTNDPRVLTFVPMVSPSPRPPWWIPVLGAMAPWVILGSMVMTPPWVFRWILMAVGAVVLTYCGAIIVTVAWDIRRGNV